MPDLTPIPWDRPKLDTTLETTLALKAVMRGDDTNDAYILDIYAENINGTAEKLLYRVKVPVFLNGGNIQIGTEIISFRGDVANYNATDETTQAATLDSLGTSAGSTRSPSINLDTFYTQAGVAKTNS